MSINRFLRGVLLFHSWKKKKQAVSLSDDDASTPEPQFSRFLSLPIELFDYISEFTSLSDQILLSQTCHGLYSMLKTKCRLGFNQKLPEEQMLLRHEISQRLPDYFLCITCRQLHMIYTLKKPSPSDQCYRGLDQNWTPISCSTFEISHHYIQTAVKLARMQNMHTTYLEDMLQASTTWSGTIHLQGTLTSQAKIIRGRFYLRIRREFTPGKHRWPSPASLKGPICGFCPHLDFWPGHEGRLYREISAAYQSFDHLHTSSRRISCECCPTDLDLEITSGYARFTVWYDLGTGLYPFEPAWECRKELPGAWFTRFKFDYTHGSIRDTYEKSM